MTTPTTIPTILGWMINLLLFVGWLMLTGGLYLVAGLGWAVLVGGLCLMAIALYVTRLYFWSLCRVQSSVQDRRG